MVFENRFKDQVAIITGGASGIGLGIAQRLLAEGAHVVLFDISREALDAVVTDLPNSAGSVRTAQVDVANEDQVRMAMENVFAQFGRLDIFINSAGITGPTNVKITDYSVDAFDKVYQVNLRGSFLGTKYAIGHMLKANYGRVLLLASISGKDGNPGMVGYTSTKAGVIGLVKGIGKEFAETGITVNGLAPAVIRTPMNEKTAPEQLKYMTDRIPMHRLGTVEETAAIACWIVSKEASFNTGAIFDLSGGRATY